MIFDLQGKRRRLVQGVYLTLAVLMGGGLVLFGIGGDVSGGLFDAFSDRNRTADTGTQSIEQRVAAAERRLTANPRDEAALKEVVRGNYQVAAQTADPNTGVFTAEGKARLQRASVAWDRYLAQNPERVDDSLAGVMVQAYSQAGLNQPAKAAQAAEVVSDARPTANAYLQLAQYASLAGQARKADLAGRRAIELAPREDRREVRRLVQQVKAGPASG